jgi:hypothetical protein
MTKNIFFRAFFLFLLMGLVAPVSAEEKPAPDEKAAAFDQEDVSFARIRGFYLEGRAGTFFTLGGARGYSNMQPLFGFELGYDFTEALSVQLSYLSGYQAGNPLVYPEECSGTGCNSYHLDFGVTFFNLSADYDILQGQRWALEGRAGGGAVVINPSAKPGQGPIDFDIFGGVRFEVYTLLKHFSVGLEADFYYVISTGVPATSVSFSVLYNF